MRRILRWGIPSTIFFMIIATVLAIPPQQQGSPENLFQQRVLELREDLERLADQQLGGSERPEGWTGNEDFSSPSMLADLWLDNERLRVAVYGLDDSGNEIFPLEWAGATSRNADIVARNIRHDLEILANVVFGPDLRPETWHGGPRITECSRTTMNTLLILQNVFTVRETTPETVRVYCETLEGEIADTLLERALGEDYSGVAQTVPNQLLAVRGDLERLADEILGLDQRPPGWVDNIDETSVNFTADLLADLERLADIVMNGTIRPAEWIGSTRTSSLTTFRNLRHDLEILADIVMQQGNRPNGWQGTDPLQQCDPTLQTLALLAEVAYDYELPETEATGVALCNEVRSSANAIVENPPQAAIGPEGTASAQDVQFSGEAQWAFAYLDPAATQYMGSVPAGTKFRAWYRNFGGSTMMFVSGENFAVFIDRRWTTMEQEIFVRLPTLEGVRPLAFCDAIWCNGPGPTPTPTGSGPLMDIIQANTPPAPARSAGDAGDIAEKTQVTWNELRVNYLLHRQDIGKVQVTLEICRDAAQVACEPVFLVTDSTVGAELPAVSTFSGLNVYELPYGYSTNFRFEGDLFYSDEIWLNDPTLSD